MSTPAPDRALGAHAAALRSVPIEITICVGHAHPSLGDMLSMGPETVLPLDTRIEDDVKLFVGGRLIATGELVELDGEHAGRLAVRVTGLVGRADDAS